MDCASAPESASGSAPVDFAELGPVSLPWTKRFRVRSAVVGQDFQIDVAWPLVPPEEGRKLPVVFVLDGNHTFAMAAQAARSLQGGPFPMAPTLVVGIGYHFERTEDLGRWGLLRVRDFTPCSDKLFEEQYPGAPVTPDGADDFLRFLEEELTPFLAERLPIDAADRTLVGASLGGFFALYAVMNRPQAFQRCIAISPAIYWGDSMLLEMEAQLSWRAQDLPLRLFLAAGGLEEGHGARQALVSNVYRLEALLRGRNYPNLDLATRIFEGENHMSVFPAAVTRGLGHVFGGYPDMSDWARALRR